MLNDSTRLGLGRLQLLPEIDAMRSHCSEDVPLHTLFQKVGQRSPFPFGLKRVSLSRCACLVVELIQRDR